MENKTDICTNCGNPKSSSSGSMSSYIRLCNCDLKLSDDKSLAVQLCKNCGKRVGKGRDGSITQFIFRSDTCDCKEPNVDYIDSQPKFSYQPFTGFDESEEDIPIEVDSKQFPTERYNCLRLLGQGGYSSVYLARDKVLNKRVAIKLLHIVDPEQLIMFQEEARATSKVKHQSIINILDFGATEESAPYMVLEYFPGVTAEEYLLRSGPFQWEQAVEIVKQVASALQHSHKQGIFHRDLKPSNILISMENKGDLHIKLIDFGIASIQKGSGKITQYQGKTLAGTPNYMSPDVINGYSYTEASEVYSLGCVFYELLTNQSVFEGETALEILAQHSNSEPNSILDVVETKVPSKIDEIIQVCLNKDPELRYNSMELLSNSLEDITRTISASESKTNLVQKNNSKPKILRLVLPLFIISIIALIPLRTHLFQSQKTSSKSLKNIKKSSVAIPELYKILDSEVKEPFDDTSANDGHKFRRVKFNAIKQETWIARNPRNVSDQDLKIFKDKANIVKGLDLTNS